MGRIAAIDYGRARIGLAISDESRIIAQLLPTIQVAKTPVHTAQLIAQALSAYKTLDRIVVGLPLLLNGTEGEMAKEVRTFAASLEHVLSLPIVFWDERLTSAGVEKMLIGMDVSRKKRAELSDAMAAVSILQNYLDSLKVQ